MVENRALWNGFQARMIDVGLDIIGCRFQGLDRMIFEERVFVHRVYDGKGSGNPINLKGIKV